MVTISPQESRQRFHRWLRGNDIQAGTSDMAAAHGRLERIDVHERTARRVHDHRAARKLGQLGGADHSARFVGQQRIERKNIGGAQKLRQGARPLDAERKIDPVGQIRIEEQTRIPNAFARMPTPPRSARADDAQRLNTTYDQGCPNAFIMSRRGRGSPSLANHGAAAGRGQRQHDRQGMIGHLARAVVRHVAHEYVPLGSGDQVDAVIPDPDPHQHGQLGKPIKSDRVT